MATWIQSGQYEWSGSRDREGHRTFRVSHRVQSDNGLDGPANVLRTPGLPLPGAFWLFDNDVDVWAYCTPEATVKPAVDGERNKHWIVEQVFSTKPPDRKQARCQDSEIEDPLLEPMKVNGSFTRDKVEASFDRYGNPILSSSHEQMRGNQVEFDDGQGSVIIEQNVPDLQLPILAAMDNTVNDQPMWGLPARSIKLTVEDWKRNFYGFCSVYYTRVLRFEAKVRTDPQSGIAVSGWDRDLLDEGTKVLNGHWDTASGAWVLDNVGGASPNPDNPNHFCRFTDRNGNPIRAILNGNGLPAETQIGTGSPFVTGVGQIHVEKYNESNFFLLGIPLTV